MRLSRKTESKDSIQELHDRVAQLEKMIQQLSRPVFEQVTIERVYVQNPVLEHLEFGLDNIDIKELSGSLNLGNNFGVSTEKQIGKKQPTASKSSPSRNDENEEVLGSGRFTKAPTESGYRFTMKPAKATNSEKEG